MTLVSRRGMAECGLLQSLIRTHLIATQPAAPTPTAKTMNLSQATLSLTLGAV